MTSSVPLTQFTGSYLPDKKRFEEVELLQRFETSYRSRQLSLWEVGEVKELKVQQLSEFFCNANLLLALD